jgi:hypothetical protein
MVSQGGIMTNSERIGFLEETLIRHKHHLELLEKSDDKMWELIKRQLEFNEQILELLGMRKKDD